MYVLVAIPALTDLIETGRAPASAREWLTEVVAGLVIAGLVRQVRKEQLALLELARTDGLTGLGNRRAFTEALEAECARAGRTHESLSLMYLDIDHFKPVNDRLGHVRGDQLLRQLADAIARSARSGIDKGFRLGGDEFALLLPGSRAIHAEAVAQRLLANCRQADPIWHGTVGLSIGIVQFKPAEGAESLLQRADAAMYACKAAGRARPPPEPRLHHAR